MKKIVLLVAAVLLVSTSALANTHTVAGFFGGTRVDGASHLVYGAEYEYHPTIFFGLTAFGEKTDVSWSEYSFGAGLAVHPFAFGGFKLVAIPGVLRVESDNHFLFRAGAAYDMGLGPIVMGPAVYGDFTKDSTAVTFGLTVGFGF